MTKDELTTELADLFAVDVDDVTLAFDDKGAHIHIKGADEDDFEDDAEDFDTTPDDE